MSEPNGNGDDLGPDDLSGPIELPEGANCSVCAYSRLIPKIDDQTGQPAIGQHSRICIRQPPSMVFRFLDSQRAAYGPAFPEVADNIVCFEFDEQLEPPIIPTGLSFGAENED